MKGVLAKSMKMMEEDPRRAMGEEEEENEEERERERDCSCNILNPVFICFLTAKSFNHQLFLLSATEGLCI